MNKRRRGMRLARRRWSPAVHLIFTGGLVAAAVALFFYGQWQRCSLADQSPPAPPAAQALPPAGSLCDQVDAALAELGLWPELVRKARGVSLSSPLPSSGDRIEVRVPADLPLAELNLHLTRLVERGGGRVLSAAERQAGQQVEIYCQADQPTLFVLKRDPQLRRRAGQIAILLDEFGSQRAGRRRLERFCGLPHPLALAVLPAGDQLSAVLDLAQGHELFVHVPLPADPGDRLTTEEVRQRVRSALKKVPGAAGLSAPAADSLGVAEVLREARRSDLLFVDSRTSLSFDIAELASAMQVRVARGDLFIDAVADRPAVEQKLWDLAALAAQQGSALGIGHDREPTLLALEAVLPRLESRGFRLVPLSQLAR